MSIEAGPAMDRLVHERVFCGRAEHRWIRWGANLYRTCLWCGGQFRDGLGEPKGCGVIPPYSTDIAATWKVVEALKKASKTYEGKAWYAFTAELGMLNTPMEADDIAYGLWNLTPAAICTAALNGWREHDRK